MAAEWHDVDMRGVDPEQKQPLLGLAKLLVPYLMSHNTEAEACDLLMEIEKMDMLLEFVDATVYTRVCSYLKRSSITLCYLLLLTPFTVLSPCCIVSIVPN